MYEDLDLLLTDYEKDDEDLNYWYDSVCSDAIEIINEFDEEDWEELFENLDSKSDGWKDRLAYCMVDPKNLNQLKVLEILSSTNNKDLFLRTIDMLRFGFDIKSLKNKDEILRKIDSIKYEEGSFEQKMIMDYKNKANKV